MYKSIKSISQRIPQIEWVSCHRRPDRSFFWRGRQFPVCARCTGIHAGYLVYPLFLFDIIYLDLWITLLLILPTYLDGFFQAFFDYESKNILRVTSGIAAGVGIVSLICIIGSWIGYWILSIT